MERETMTRQSLNRRQFLRGLCSAAVGLPLAGVARRAAAQAVAASGIDATEMNILMIGVEDLRAIALGCYGNTICKTPNIDALAGQGMRFDRAYCSSPVCNPSRTAMVTGLRPDSNRVYHNSEYMDKLVPEGAPFIADLLKPKGAWLANIGKLCHKDFSSQRFMNNFDQIQNPDDVNDLGQTVTYTPLEKEYTLPFTGPDSEKKWLFVDDPEMEETLKERQVVRDALVASGIVSTWEIRKPFQQLWSEINGDSGHTAEHGKDGVIALTGCEMIKDFAADKKQWFLHIGLYGTHTPLVAPKQFVDMYKPDDMPLPTIKPEDDVNIPPVAKRNGENLDNFSVFEQTPERVRKAIASYYACASSIDWCVGHILETLEKTGMADKTIILFYGDHGFHLGEHGLWSKFTLFDQSIRAPVIVYVPGMAGMGKPCDEIIEMVDFVPTFMDLWGLPRDPRLEGLSFAPLLNDPTLPWKKAAFSMITLGGLGRSVRTRRYKYAEYRKDRSLPGKGVEPFVCELYDLDNDPWEQVNVVDDPAYADARARLARMMVAGWRGALPDGVDVP
jgi:uncharacterized sulfatase